MKIQFECIVCGRRETASVREEDLESDDRPLETLHDCTLCGMETIWLET